VPARAIGAGAVVVPLGQLACIGDGTFYRLPQEQHGKKYIRLIQFSYRKGWKNQQLSYKYLPFIYNFSPKEINHAFADSLG
jgi:hypothetical protein